MLQIQRSRRVATATTTISVAACGILVLQIVYLSLTTAASFDSWRYTRAERLLVDGSDGRCRQLGTLRLGWTADRPPYLRKEKDQRTRLERNRSCRSRSSAHCTNISEPWRGGEQHSRAILSLITIRGGSEGLKSEAYDPQKATAGAGSKTSGKGSSPAKTPDGYDDYTYGSNSYKEEQNLHYWQSYATPPAINPPETETTVASQTPPQSHGNPYKDGTSATTRLGETASVAALVRDAVRAAAAETSAPKQQSIREVTSVGLGAEAGSDVSPAGENRVSGSRFSNDNKAMASWVDEEGEGERAREALAGEGAFQQESSAEEAAAFTRGRRPWGHDRASTVTFPVGLGDAKVSVGYGDNGITVASSLARARAMGSVRGVLENPLQQPRKRSKLVWKPKYMTVKAVFFFFYSSLGAIMPYLPVYYHSLALSDRQIGHLGAITPAMTFLFTPLWGALTDKSGMLKQILLVTFVASTVLRVSLIARTSFPWIMSIVAMTAIMNAPVRPLLDSSVLQALDDRGEYGKQRLWGQWGFGVGSFVTGGLLSRLGFKAAFYIHAAFSLPALLILLRFRPKKEDRAKGPPRFGELYRVMVHDSNVAVFFSMVFAIGLSSGVIENFAYKRLRELGGTGSVLGMSRLVSSLAGIPMFFFSGSIVKKFSIVAILTAAMMSYIARFVIYASIKNPWAGLPAEALRGVTFAGFWAASTCHVGAIAPPGLSTTMLGLLNATYGGIGQSLGSLIGGSLSARFGTARAFLVYAGVDGLLLLAYFSFWSVRPKAHCNTTGGGGGVDPSPGGDISTPGTGALQPLPSTTVTSTAPPSPAGNDMPSVHAFESKSR